MSKPTVLLSSLCAALSLALGGCGGGDALGSDEAAEETVSGVEEDRIVVALGATRPAATDCDTGPADGRIQFRFSTDRATVNSGTTYGAVCPRYKLDFVNRAPDGIPIAPRVDVTVRYTGPALTTKAACERQGMAAMMTVCTAGTCRDEFDVFSITGVWNGSSCKPPSISRGLVAGAHTYRIHAIGAPNKNLSISVTSI